MDFNRKIWLNADELTKSVDMQRYLKRLFPDVPYIDRNPDKLYINLKDIDEETDILLSRKCVDKVCASPFAFRVLIGLGKAADENPHIHLLFRQ